MILLLDLMGAAAGQMEGMREEAFRGNCKIMVVHYVTMTGSPRKLCVWVKLLDRREASFLWTQGVNIT